MSKKIIDRKCPYDGTGVQWEGGEGEYGLYECDKEGIYRCPECNRIWTEEGVEIVED